MTPTALRALVAEVLALDARWPHPDDLARYRIIAPQLARAVEGLLGVVEALGPVIDMVRAVPADLLAAHVVDSIAIRTLTFGDVRTIRTALAALEAPATPRTPATGPQPGAGKDA